MNKTINLRLINDEKKNARILSAKACTIDNAVCSNGANDICQSLDYAGCYGNILDYCKYLDVSACFGKQNDICDYDYEFNCNNYNLTTDFCLTDR